MKVNRYRSQIKLKTSFEDQEIPFDLTLASKYLFDQDKCKAQYDESIEKCNERRKKTKLKNGFMISEALIALFICSMSGFLVLAASSALSKMMQMDVQSEMNLNFEMDFDQINNDSL